MKTDKEIFDFFEIICRIFDGNATEDELSNFELSLSEDQDLLNFYTQTAEILGHLLCPVYSIGLTQSLNVDMGNTFFTDLMQQLLENEKEEVVTEYQTPIKESVLEIEENVAKRIFRKLNRFYIFNIASLFVMVFLLHFTISKHKVEIVYLVDSIYSKWSFVGKSASNFHWPWDIISPTDIVMKSSDFIGGNI